MVTYDHNLTRYMYRTSRYRGSGHKPRPLLYKEKKAISAVEGIKKGIETLEAIVETLEMLKGTDTCIVCSPGGFSDSPTSMDTCTLLV